MADEGEGGAHISSGGTRAIPNCVPLINRIVDCYSNVGLLIFGIHTPWLEFPALLSLDRSFRSKRVGAC